MKPFVLALSMLLACAGASADERGELRHQRETIETRYKAATLACQDRFLVNACRDEARATRNADLRPIQAREEVLDARERKARAETQAARVAERQREFAAEEGRRRTEALQPQRLENPPAPRGALPSRTLPVDPEVHAREVRRQADEAARSAVAAREQAGKRQRLVLQHQQDVQKRQDEKEAATAAKGKPAAKPLPIPSADEIAGAASAARR